MASPMLDDLTFSEDEFFAWHERQEERYELIHGHPVRMMTGASNRHVYAVDNIVASLRPQVRNNGGRTSANDQAVRTGPGQIRYPDVTVSCGPDDLDGYTASNPTVVVEVLSDSTKVFDATGKLAEYKQVASIQVVLHVSPREVLVDCYRRDGSNWSQQRHTDIDDVIDLPEVGARLPLADIYEDLDPQPSTHLSIVQ